MKSSSLTSRSARLLTGQPVGTFLLVPVDGGVFGENLDGLQERPVEGQ